MSDVRPVLLLLPILLAAASCEKTNPPKPGSPDHEIVGNTNTRPATTSEPEAAGGAPGVPFAARFVSSDAAAGTLTVSEGEGSEPRTLKVAGHARGALSGLSPGENVAVACGGSAAAGHASGPGRMPTDSGAGLGPQAAGTTHRAPAHPAPPRDTTGSSASGHGATVEGMGPSPAAGADAAHGGHQPTATTIPAPAAADAGHGAHHSTTIPAPAAGGTLPGGGFAAGAASCTEVTSLVRHP